MLGDDIMKIMYILDKDNYITSYGIYNEIPDDEGNMYCPYKMGDGSVVEIDISEAELRDLYNAYRVIDGEVVLDEKKQEEIIHQKQQPVYTNEEILKNLVNEIINE
jgi:hypothetical protein